MSNTRVEDNFDYSFFGENMPCELQELFLDEFQKSPFFLRLGAVCKKFRERVIQSESFKFFPTNYVKNPLLNHFIISPDYLTASHVRAGNRCVMMAIGLLEEGDMPAAEKLLRKAAFRYGSVIAMGFIKLFSTLPGRVALPDLEEVYKVYGEKISTALLSELQMLENGDLNKEAYNATTLFGQEITAFQNVFTKIYKSDNGFSSVNASKCLKMVKLEEVLQKDRQNPQALSDLMNNPPFITSLNDIACYSITYRLQELRLPDVDLCGYMGRTTPSNSDVWYLHTTSHQKFLHFEMLIDQLLTTNKIVVPDPHSRLRN